MIYRIISEKKHVARSSLISNDKREISKHFIFARGMRRIRPHLAVEVDLRETRDVYDVIRSHGAVQVTHGRHAHAGRPRRPQLTQGDCINISTFLVFSAVGASLQQPAVGVTTSEYGVFVHDARPPLIGGRRLTGSLLLGILAISGACFLLLVFLVSLPFICTPLGCSTFYPLHSKLEVILFFKILLYI